MVYLRIGVSVKMKIEKLSFFLSLIGLLCISVCSLRPAPALNHMQYVFRWPATYCKPSSVKCKPPPPHKFTLVGFWGADANGVPEQDCEDKAEAGWADKYFDANKVSAMEKFWPALLTGEVEKEMWIKAWVTYGTCAALRLKDPITYFNKAIKVATDMGDLLEDHLIKMDGIVPCTSAVYTNKEILEGLTRVANKKDVSFSCKMDSGRAFLEEVTFCFNVDVKGFVNCPTSVTNKRCKADDIVVPRP